MGGSDAPADGPAPAEFASVFDVYDVRRDGDRLLYVGEPRTAVEALERRVWPLFRDAGYEVSLEEGYHPSGDGQRLSSAEYVLVARPRNRERGIPWTNVALFGATLVSSLFAGAWYWYSLPVFSDPLSALAAWPFAAAILAVLGVHEMGHYVMSRYHDVEATLPYFIPQPFLIGSFGAVIRMRGRIPDRRALFDIGVAGPLAGLAATAVVTVIGLQLDPLPVQEAAAEQVAEGGGVVFHNPPLMILLAHLAGATEHLTGVAHPVVFAGWVGMLMTLLNLLPAGQFDGGHITRAMFGKRQETLAAVVPGALFLLAGYLLFLRPGYGSIGIWLIWGVFTLGMAYSGPATPIDDSPLDRKRQAIGVLTLGLGALCFTPVPVGVIPG